MQRKGLIIALALALGTQAACATPHSSRNLSQQRFLDGISSLQKNDTVGYQAAHKAVANDPLALYLEYEFLKANLSEDKRIKAFLKKNPDSFYASELRRIWLTSLGNRGDYQTFLRYYDGSSREALRCHALTARVKKSGLSDDNLKTATSLWLKGGSVSDICDNVFEQMYSKKLISADTRWQRIFLALEKNQQSLARYLAKSLPAADQQTFDLLLQMHQHPEQQLISARRWKDTPRHRQIIAHGLIRYSRNDAVAAWRSLQQDFSARFAFSSEQLATIHDSLVLRAAWRHQPEAVDIFSRIPVADLSEEALEWRVRSAIRIGDWRYALQSLDALNQDKEEWRYWRARALEATGHSSEAQALLRALATDTSYYGFMAADRLGLEYTFTSEPVVDLNAAQRVSQLKQRDAFVRIKSLYDLDMQSQAYAEWMFEVGKMSDADKRVAARLAHEWGWHFTAIATTARANHFADLELRFPMLYSQHIIDNAARENLRPSLVYGIIRRESAFKETAVSPAGALGLMQVMPRTARMVGKLLGLNKLSTAQIKDAKTNIQLGTRYLREVLDTYKNHEILATASYNAGPHRVKQWLPESGPMDADVWIDSITFDETRAYVKAVHFYSTIFDWKDDGRIQTRLSDRMTPVPAAPVKLAEYQQ